MKEKTEGTLYRRGMDIEIDCNGKIKSKDLIGVFDKLNKCMAREKIDIRIVHVFSDFSRELGMGIETHV